MPSTNQRISAKCAAPHGNPPRPVVCSMS
jgi:hypothetical protein